MNELAQKLMDVVQQQSIPTNTQEKKNSNFNPHLAVTSVEQGGAANGRNNPLLMKSAADNEEFQLFCKSMTDEVTLLALYNIVKSDDKQLLKNIIKGK
ncbi:hypothetical protein RJO76_002853 [Aeromonas veronii]|nr:hypothetical protein [Aeromonas veronii]